MRRASESRGEILRDVCCCVWCGTVRGTEDRPGVQAFSGRRFTESLPGDGIRRSGEESGTRRGVARLGTHSATHDSTRRHHHAGSPRGLEGGQGVRVNSHRPTILQKSVPCQVTIGNEPESGRQCDVSDGAQRAGSGLDDGAERLGDLHGQLPVDAGLPPGQAAEMDTAEVRPGEGRPIDRGAA